MVTLTTFEGARYERGTCGRITGMNLYSNVVNSSKIGGSAWFRIVEKSHSGVLPLSLPSYYGNNLHTGITRYKSLFALQVYLPLSPAFFLKIIFGSANVFHETYTAGMIGFVKSHN